MEQLLNGFIASLSFTNFFACFIGCLVGTIIGVLPGLGPTATLTLMLPFTLRYGPETGLIMMAGCWFGAQYGGSTTSILVNIPGESASVVTCIDGYQMAKKGRAGAALAVVAGGSFIAGTIGIIGLQFFAPLLGNAALSMGPPEYLGFLVLAFLILTALSGDSPGKGFLMLGLGLWLSMIGLSALDSIPRFTFGSRNLMLGIDFLPLAVGLFGVTEVLVTAGETYIPPVAEKIRFRDLYPNKEEIRRSISPSLRGSVLGFFVGLLPGPCVVISTFLSYAVEKKLSKTPQEFGKGMIEGVVAPESANNSAVMGAMIPLLTLGIPFTPSSAVMMAGLEMHNVDPGPLLFQNHPEIFWTFIAAMYIGNLMLLILNLPLVGLFARIATIRPFLLLPFISIVCLLGVYSVRNSFLDVWVMIAAGVVGVFFRKYGYPVAPLIIGLVLGPMIENNTRKTLMMFRGDFRFIFDRPIALVFFGLALIFVLFKFFYPYLRRSPAILPRADRDSMES
jgi:putative tricarboxylic transport membrane protein